VASPPQPPTIQPPPIQPPTIQPPLTSIAALRKLQQGRFDDLPWARVDPDHPKSAASAPERIAVGFARLLRQAGVAVPPDTTLTFARALAAVGIDRREPVYWAGRATLLRRPEDGGVYDRAFLVFWEQRLAYGTGVEQTPPSVTLGLDEAPDGEEPEPDDDDSDDGQTMAVRFSATEVLRNKDFAGYTAEEFEEARRLMAGLRFVGSPRQCRRLTPAKGRKTKGKPDLRRTVRNALRTDAIPIRRSFLVPSEKPRRIVLLCDVSGSMESYARALVRFCQAAVVGRGKVEAFALGTRLTRLTRELSARDPDLALSKAAKRVVDWSGGTRLGEGMRTFNDQWGVRGMARGSIIVILSDGWDRGDPEMLAEQMSRLHRVAHRIIWVNPLKAAPGYAPLARGMAAALPFVDVFLEGHSMASLEDLAAAVAAA
jgi:uncharacterized protein